MKRFFLRLPLAFALGLVLGAALLSPEACAGELRSFGPNSLTELRQMHRGRAFVVAFWSVTCEPCIAELHVLADLHRKFPDVPIILVAADAPRSAVTVAQRLKALELGRIETWLFADEFTEKIRFAVDRSWRGELPRTYLFNAAQEAEAHSGVLNARVAAIWFEQAQLSRSK